MAGLGDMLIAGQESVVRSRLDLADAARNLFNTVGIDAEDDFKIADSNLGGVDSVVRLSMVALATSARMPMAVFFCGGIKGAGATGAGGQTISYRTVGEVQKSKVRPPL